MSEKWRQWIECPVCWYRFDTRNGRSFEKLRKGYRCVSCNSDISGNSFGLFKSGWCPPGMVLVMDERVE